jgi:hypothetical protein
MKSAIHVAEGTRGKVLKLHVDRLCGKTIGHNANDFATLSSSLRSKALWIGIQKAILLKS